MVDEQVESGGNADASFRLRSSELWTQPIGIGGVHFKPESALTALAPPSDCGLPAEVVDPHSLDPKTANSVLVAGAFRPEVRIIGGVLEDARGCDEMFIPAWLARGDRGGADEVELAIGRHPEQHRRLDKVIPIHKDGILGLIAGFICQVLPQQVGIRLLFVFGDIQSAVHLVGIKRSQPRSIVLAWGHARQRHTNGRKQAQQPRKSMSAAIRFDHMRVVRAGYS